MTINEGTTPLMTRLTCKHCGSRMDIETAKMLTLQNGVTCFCERRLLNDDRTLTRNVKVSGRV
jgi:hypothetical protein